MLAINSTQKLSVVLGGAKTTNDVTGVIVTEDVQTPAAQPIGPGGGMAPAQLGLVIVTPFKTAGATPVTIAAAPTAGFVRKVRSLFMFNADTASSTVSLSVIDATPTTWTYYKVVLATLENVQWIDGQGFRCFTTAGSLKNST